MGTDFKLEPFTLYYVDPKTGEYAPIMTNCRCVDLVTDSIESDDEHEEFEL